MNRKAFLRRMIFAGLATWFVDLPLPKEVDRPLWVTVTDYRIGPWHITDEEFLGDFSKEWEREIEMQTQRLARDIDREIIAMYTETYG